MKKIRLLSMVLVLFIVFNISMELTAVQVKADDSQVVQQMTRKEKRAEKKRIRKLNKDVKRAKKKINKKKYDNAIEILVVHLDEESNEEAVILYTMLDNYKKAKRAMDENLIDMAKGELEAIDESYKNYKIAVEINDLKSEIEILEAKNAKINSKIEAINALVLEEKYDEAESVIAALSQEELDIKQQDVVREIKTNVDAAINQIAEQKRLEEERIKSEEQARIEAEKKSVEEARIAQEKKNQISSTNKASSSNNSNSNNNSNISSSATYYVAPGNRYYHKTPGCKFLEGASTTKVSDVSNKFACNCTK